MRINLPEQSLPRIGREAAALRLPLERILVGYRGERANREETAVRRHYSMIRNVYNCYFYPGRDWVAEYRDLQGFTPEMFQLYLESGYYRQGERFYVPVCITCQECIAVRLPVEEYRASKSQRRIWRDNQDLRVVVAKPSFTEEKFRIYQQYHANTWGWSTEDPEQMERHLLRDWGESWEFSYYEGDRLLGFGIVDETPDSANSAYFVYDCDKKRGLGIFSLMWELEWCARRGKKFLYLGPYVALARCMDYKVSFRPFDFRLGDGSWQRFQDKDEAQREIVARSGGCRKGHPCSTQACEVAVPAPVAQ